MVASGAVAVSEKKPAEYARYSSCKVDVEVLRRCRAKAQLEGRPVQEWISDVLNAAASEALNMDPIKRKPAPPHPKRNPPKR